MVQFILVFQTSTMFGSDFDEPHCILNSGLSILSLPFTKIEIWIVLHRCYWVTIKSTSVFQYVFGSWKFKPQINMDLIIWKRFRNAYVLFFRTCMFENDFKRHFLTKIWILKKILSVSKNKQLCPLIKINNLLILPFLIICHL